MIIRRMTEEDLHKVAELERKVFADPWSENIYRQTLQLPDVAYVVCENEGEIIAVAGVRNIVGEGEITNVMVDEAYRGRGISKEVLRRLLEEGEKLGICDFTLEVRASNSVAIRLYEKLGFVSEGIRPGFYEHPKEDALIMWKRNG